MLLKKFFQCFTFTGKVSFECFFKKIFGYSYVFKSTGICNLIHYNLYKNITLKAMQQIQS